jgi:hypothetical protein
MLFHLIHTQNHIYTRSSQNNKTDWESYPLKERLTEGQQQEAGIVPPGEFTSTWVFIETSGML